MATTDNETQVCDDSCASARNGTCDDGQNWNNAACSPGTDCTDCGLPDPDFNLCADGVDNDGNGVRDCDEEACEAAPMCLIQEQTEDEGPFGAIACLDSFDNDGDGLVDCEDPDCEEECVEFGSEPDHPDSPTGCDETCQYSSDGECDDGGPGSDYHECGLGTDCADCGSR
jgi:hypothetical protein